MQQIGNYWGFAYGLLGWGSWLDEPEGQNIWELEPLWALAPQSQHL